MDLNKALENMKYDSRMMDWNVKQGLVKTEELESHAKALPDSASLCEPVTLEDREDFGD